MSGRLLHELSTVGENESLNGITIRWWDSIDELCEDNLWYVNEVALKSTRWDPYGLAATCGKRYTQPLVPFLQVREYGLDTFLLILP